VSDGALSAARERAAGLDPESAAAAVGATYRGTGGRGEIEVAFLASSVTVTVPAFECRPSETPLPSHVCALLVYHLAISDGSRPTGRWISFAELPDGGFYVTAFRGYTGAVIARRFGADTGALGEALAQVNAEPTEGMADRAWKVPALPRVPMALLWWDGDDEFEPRAELLFDATASHHLTTDGCAVLGSWLTATICR
jgi:hypothetical protein